MFLVPSLGLFGGLFAPSGLGIAASGHTYSDLGFAKPDTRHLEGAGKYALELFKLKPKGSHRSLFNVPIRFPGSAIQSSFGVRSLSKRSVDWTYTRPAPRVEVRKIKKPLQDRSLENSTSSKHEGSGCNNYSLKTCPSYFV